MKRQIPIFCGKDCGGDACPLLATIEDGRVTRVSNNPAGGDYLKGCRRGFNLHLSQYAPDRLTQPLIRSGVRGSGLFREASWDEALDIVANRLEEVRTKYGSHSILNMGSAGSLGALHNTGALLSRFLNLFGGGTNLTGGYSNGAASFVLPYLLGTDYMRSGFDAATMQYAEMIILWGANLLETRMGSEVPQRLLEARKRGAQIVVIDPRRSATVKQTATWWLPIRPGTDVALMLAVLHVLITEKLTDRSFIMDHSVGFDQLESYILGLQGGEPRSPQWASLICGLSVEEIVRFARAYAAAKPAMLFPGYAIQRVFAGEESYRLTIALQVATGNFGVKGGSTGSINSRLPSPRVGKIQALKRVASPSAPVQRWPDAVLEGRAGGYASDLHAIYVVGANYLNQGSEIKKGIAAFEHVEFSVCHEMFLTPTARYCDVILPIAGPLEKEDIGLPWLGNYLLYKAQAVSPVGAARADYDIFCDLAERLGFGEEYSEGRSAAEWIQYFIDESEVPDQEAFRRTGVYLAPDQERVGLADFCAEPERYPLSTPSGKVEIASEQYATATGFPAIPIWQPQPEDARYPLRLLTPKSPNRTHSQGSNIPAIMEKDAHALEMHPQDAAARGIEDGDLVTLYNAQGSVRVAARLTDDLTAGVVCMREGVWFTLDKEGSDIAGSANMLTSTQGSSPAVACIMHGVGVQVARNHLTDGKNL